MSEWENSAGGSDEYYTPPEIFGALDVTFDLDPCCSESIHCCVPCRKAFYRNGLEKQWKGFVWMNPPFGRRNGVIPWLEKFVRHGNGLGLVRAYTSSGWFHEFIPQMDAILFPEGKTKFIRQDGTVAKQPGHGVVLFSLGRKATKVLKSSDLGLFFEVK